MTTLYAYVKKIDSITTHTLRLPHAPGGHEPQGQELATLPDGRTVVALFAGAALPTEQPAEIAASIEALPSPLPSDLREAIKAASPQVRLINERVVAQIRARYSQDDEIGLLRRAPSAETSAWSAWVEDCRAWGRGEKAKLGL